jgi:hypothetical protein
MLLRYEGVEWRLYSGSGASRLDAIHGAGSEQVWAIGDALVAWDGSGGAILHWDGVSVEQPARLTSNMLYGITSIPAGDLFAVGLGGTILHRLPQ